MGSQLKEMDTKENFKLKAYKSKLSYNLYELFTRYLFTKVFLIYQIDYQYWSRSYKQNEQKRWIELSNDRVFQMIIAARILQ